MKPENVESLDMHFSSRKNRILLTSNELLFDTGSSSTVLFDTNDIDETLWGYCFTTEGSTQKRKWTPIYYTDKFQIDSLTINNLYFVKVKPQHLARSIGCSGIIGMNVIG
jgi:hypothetical protein